MQRDHSVVQTQNILPWILGGQVALLVFMFSGAREKASAYLGFRSLAQTPVIAWLIALLAVCLHVWGASSISTVLTHMFKADRLRALALAAAVHAIVSTALLGAATAIVHLAGDRNLGPCVVAHAVIDALIEPGLPLAAVEGRLGVLRERG